MGIYIQSLKTTFSQPWLKCNFMQKNMNYIVFYSKFHLHISMCALLLGVDNNCSFHPQGDHTKKTILFKQIQKNSKPKVEM